MNSKIFGIIQTFLYMLWMPFGKIHSICTSIIALCVVLLFTIQPVNAQGHGGLYFSDFETGAGAEWSNRLTELTPSGRRFLGRFNTSSVSLNLSQIPAHQEITVEYDLFVIASWDGNNSFYGPDLWDCSVINGPSLVHSTFSNAFAGETNFRQSYPGSYPIDDHPGLSGSTEQGTLGYTRAGGYSGVPDAVYHVKRTFHHTADTLQIKFAGLMNSDSSGINDESWGLDNVRVTLADPVVTVQSAKMISANTLQVDVQVTFSIATAATMNASLATTINGQALNPDTCLDCVWNIPANTDGQVVHSFKINLQNANVPRFSENERFDLTAKVGAVTSKSKGAVILLPIVLVPGIDVRLNAPDGGPTSFPSMVTALVNLSTLAVTSQYIASPYTAEDSTDPYATIYTLSYDRNNDSFSDGAKNLSTLINSITNKQLSYANKVNLVAHSKGGLVGRAYLQTYGGLKVNQYIMAQSPHLGSLWAVLFRLNLVTYNYQNLWPIYNATRRSILSDFKPFSQNEELANLNWNHDTSLPSEVKYSIIWSNAIPTWSTITLVKPPQLGTSTVTGDFIVPWFSQKGLLFDPNHPDFLGPLPTIRAFQGVAINYYQVDGNHVGFFDTVEAQDKIFNILTSNVFP